MITCSIIGLYRAVLCQDWSCASLCQEVSDNGYGPCLQQSYDQSTGDVPVDNDQQSTSPVCALCEVSHSHMGKVGTWQSTQAYDVHVVSVGQDHLPLYAYV